jgi:hypothetical protein
MPEIVSAEDGFHAAAAVSWRMLDRRAVRIAVICSLLACTAAYGYDHRQPGITRVSF